MPAKIVVPELGESILEATVGHWLKNEGDHVSAGEVLVSLETDKVDLEVGTECGGVLARIERREGDDVKIGDTLGEIEEAPAGTQPSEVAPTAAAKSKPVESATAKKKEANVSGVAAAKSGLAADTAAPGPAATPSARRLARERAIDLNDVAPSDGGGRVTKQDVESHLARTAGTIPLIPAPTPAAPIPAALPATPPGPSPGAARSGAGGERREERIRMSRRRQTIAKRLVEAQHAAAMLTTFNEVDMSVVMELRNHHRQAFQERYGVRLGIASFFVKAAVAALRQFPRINAELDGDEIVLKHYYDIGIAVGAVEGLVVPVLRNADRLSFAEIERGIKDFARRAQDRTLTLEDLRGGTFSISNGGVFGSLMSTPILNPPQVAILGLHKVQDRPVSLQGQIVTHPMMYVALSYDHRIVDGLEAVQFLVRVKQLVEEPVGLLLEV
ncbi:MAG TPA: 2-oxoglutarate dehydrogenase complex dihydrolipoyllysine-residue succinyltransferase [Terriglobia bacterium]|nr:2-oxoglutarate dehydrogenase complex dihydrolipoyllysine-residue succinyltransferase [Terriglobia bacterium]